jgi:hypothetical protein
MADLREPYFASKKRYLISVLSVYNIFYEKTFLTLFRISLFKPGVYQQK